MLKQLDQSKDGQSVKFDALAATQESRRLLFISHANPEDNEAASWFATQLTLMGYEVWCDLKNTRGGESDFWLKVQKTIEHEAAKFIFILSNTSRDFAKKKGLYKEVQAADNLRRENFIIPLRIEPLSGSLPIIIGPDLYINSENWADGLRCLHERLVEDAVPRNRDVNYERIASWWPALSIEEALIREEPQELVSNLLTVRSLPTNLHILKVSADRNLIAGSERLRRTLPSYPAHYAHGDYAASFACAHDFLELTCDYEIEDHAVLETAQFMEHGCEPTGIIPPIARNIVTFLVASSLENFLEDKGLKMKSIGRSRRKIWFPAAGLINNNKHRLAEHGRRRTAVQFVGTVKHFRKRYMWHFGIQPVVDLYTMCGVLLSPKAVLTLPYSSGNGEKPIPVDEKKALKKLGWWNKEWRQKLIAFTAWLSDSQEIIRLPAGYQEIMLSGQLEPYASKKSYLEKDDDAVLKEILGWADAKRS